MYNRLVAAPGDSIELGSEGGVLLLAPPSLAPGSMSLTDLQNRTWHLLREDGPDTGYPAPTTGDFPIQVVTRDLNIAFADFLSQTGIAPGLIERQDTLPVFALLDHPVPPGLQSLTRIEYTPYGQGTYVLDGKSFGEFDRATGGWVSNLAVNRPYIYREPYAGYVRLQPQPSIGNQVGPGVGYITITGTPAAGIQVGAVLDNPGYPSVTVPAYSVTASDDVNSIAFNLSQNINATNAVIGPNPFLSPTSSSQNQVQINALNAPGTTITFYATVTAGALIVSPTSATTLAPTGDTMTWYYTAAGNILANPGDSPKMPPQFHMALVYRVLEDYWLRKQDMAQAAAYGQRFIAAVARGKAFTYDSNRATEPTLASGGFDTSDLGAMY